MDDRHRSGRGTVLHLAAHPICAAGRSAFHRRDLAHSPERLALFQCLLLWRARPHLPLPLHAHPHDLLPHRLPREDQAGLLHDLPSGEHRGPGDHQLHLVRQPGAHAPHGRTNAPALHGHEPVAALHLHGRYLALLDIHMPGPNGLEVGRTLKAERPEMHIVILTMHNSPALVRQVKAAGFQGYLVKNTGAQELRDVLRCAA
ncbi:MAG: response regulator transcription factor [Flavobacteriales bacterium]|nr:response regulator transcription factor [Flavobacteriales bacterium]MBK7271275.1 response regulator transcription factor [Flavobacteriales bacterium]MBK7753298.1 response regulator transcription factor [Flavobacteriales bacterium]MBK9538868.1 response regulator transcription factor [Flavobacteriales bacterium]